LSRYLAKMRKFLYTIGRKKVLPLVFYEIHIHTQPIIRFAITLYNKVRPNSKNIIDHRKDMIELAFNENADVQVATGEQIYAIPPKAICVFMPDCRYDLQITGDRVMENSVAVEIPDIQFKRHESEDYGQIAAMLAAADKQTLFIPQIIQTDDEDFTLLTSMFTTIANHFIGDSTADYYQSLSAWYELVAHIDAEFREKIEQEVIKDGKRHDSSHYYVYKAKKYICSHYCQRLTLQSIADNLGISPNYFSTIFKKGTGKSVVDYINHLRMQEVRRLINQDNGMTLQEICNSVGLHDIRHVQRLFKRYYGVSMQRCRLLDHGISLYHTNPWEQEDIDHDIFDLTASPGQEPEK